MSNQEVTPWAWRLTDDIREESQRECYFDEESYSESICWIEDNCKGERPCKIGFCPFRTTIHQRTEKLD
jgi:hypothetical protein